MTTLPSGVDKKKSIKDVEPKANRRDLKGEEVHDRKIL